MLKSIDLSSKMFYIVIEIGKHVYQFFTHCRFFLVNMFIILSEFTIPFLRLNAGTLMPLKRFLTSDMRKS